MRNNIFRAIYYMGKLLITYIYQTLAIFSPTWHGS